MQGQNRSDYGKWEICALDMERNIFILNRWSWEEKIDMYCVLDCAKDEIITLPTDSYKLLDFWAYHDGWCYFDIHEDWSSGICRVVGISLEGEQKEIMTMTSSHNTIKEKYNYTESICRMEVVEDRIYIIFGGYFGSDSYFQGGSLITMKLDGSDYRAIECKEDAFVICKDGDRILVYFPYYWPQEDWSKEKKRYLMGVWDIETNTLFPSDFPRELVYEQQRHSILTYQERIIPKPLCLMKEDGINVYALEDSGRIVQVATDIDKAIIQREDKEINYSIDYEHLYYADGFLYFEVEFTVFEGARTYRRIQKDVYRMKLDEKFTELLYSY